MDTNLHNTSDTLPELTKSGLQHTKSLRPRDESTSTRTEYSQVRCVHSFNDSHSFENKSLCTKPAMLKHKILAIAIKIAIIYFQTVMEHF